MVQWPLALRIPRKMSAGYCTGHTSTPTLLGALPEATIQGKTPACQRAVLSVECYSYTSALITKFFSTWRIEETRSGSTGRAGPPLCPSLMWLPHSSRFSKGGSLCSVVTEIFFVFFYSSLMTRRLHRYYGAGYLHFITSSCYRRQALLGSAHRRKLFLEILEQVRRRYRLSSSDMCLCPSISTY